VTPAYDSPAATALRTDYAGALRSADAGRTVRLGGWVHRSRDLGGIVFMDLRDRAGLVQVSFDPRWTPPDVLALAGSVGVESTVLISGTVALRPADARNPELSTGDVEVQAATLRVVGPAVTPAIPVARGKGEQLPAEELRLRHRYLDLRRPELQANLILRHRLLQATRAHLAKNGYLEIETPILTRPAGGRPRLPRAEPRPPRRMVRAAAVAAAVQAAADGIGI
jgi:aspartyl-tRNA synthetase